MSLSWKFAVMTGVVCASFYIARPPLALLMEPVQANQNFDVPAASPIADRPIADPEAISGLWEAPDGHGGVIHLELRVDAFAPPHAKALNGIEQRLLDADVFLYRRSQAEIVRDDQNLFESPAPGGVALFEHGRLTVRVPSYGLEVYEVQGEQWSGTMQGAPILFRRPQVAGGRTSWAVGTWREKAKPGYTCLHVAQDQTGNYLGWSDMLVDWGDLVVAPGVTKPNGPQHYGELVKVNATVGKGVVFEVYAYTALCCSHRFVGTPSADGQLMHAEWEDGGNMAAHRSIFERMPGDRCVVLKSR